MISQQIYKHKEFKFESIIKSNITSTDNKKQINLIIYYKNTKLRNLVIE